MLNLRGLEAVLKSWEATFKTDQFHGDLVNFAGTLAPGYLDAGNTTIFGDYSQQDQATLDFDIGGSAVGSEYDFISVQGDAFLDGFLKCRSNQ